MQKFLKIVNCSLRSSCARTRSAAPRSELDALKCLTQKLALVVVESVAAVGFAMPNFALVLLLPHTSSPDFLVKDFEVLEARLGGK